MISSKYSHSNSIVSFTEHNTRGRAWTKKFWTNHVFELLTSIISWIHRYYRHWHSNPSSGDIFRGRGKSRNADSIFQVQHSQAWFLYIYMAIESCHDGNLYPSIHSIGGALSTWSLRRECHRATTHSIAIVGGTLLCHSLLQTMPGSIVSA